MTDSCRTPRLLAQGPVCAVEECECGIVHVTLGMLTLHLQRETLALIWETVGEALQRLATTRPPSSYPNIAGIGARRTSAGRPS